MSKSNGAKQFLFVVRFGRRDGAVEQFLVLGSHTPDAFELSRLLHLDYDPQIDELEAQRYDLDALPTLPSKP